MDGSITPPPPGYCADPPTDSTGCGETVVDAVSGVATVSDDRGTWIFMPWTAAGAARDKRVVLVQAVTVEATPGGYGGGHADGVYAGGGHDDNYKDLNNGGDTDCEKGGPAGDGLPFSDGPEPSLTAVVEGPWERPYDFHTPISVSISAKNCALTVSEIVSGPADAGVLINRRQPHLNSVVVRHVGGRFDFVYYYKWRAVFLTHVVLCFLFLEAAKNSYVYGPRTSLAFTLPAVLAALVWHTFYYCIPLGRGSRFHDVAVVALMFGLLGLDCGWEYYVHHRQLQADN